MELKNGYKKTEVGIIPDDWDMKTLGEVGDVKMCKRVFNYQTKSQGSIPFYKIGTFGKEADAYISQELYDNFRQRFSFPKKGDILISAAGTIGRTIIFDDKPSYFQDSNIVWIENDETLIPNKFLYHVLQVVKYNTEGGTIQRLYNSILRNSKFICPPTKAEQTTIATALSDADALITSLERLIAKKKAIQIVVMEELVSGNKRLKGYEGKWGQFSIAEISKTFTKQTGFDYSAYIKPKLVMKDGYDVIPFIQNKDFNERSINFNTDYYIPENVANQFPKILLDEKCLLISISGSVGKVGIFGNAKKAFLGGAIAVGKFYDKTQLDWVMCYLLSYAGQKKLLDNVKSGSHQNLILDDIRKVYVPMPSLQERNAITDLLFDMNDEIDVLEQKLQKSRMIKQGMMQNLLTGKIRLV